MWDVHGTVIVHVAVDFVIVMDVCIPVPIICIHVVAVIYKMILIIVVDVQVDPGVDIIGIDVIAVVVKVVVIHDGWIDIVNE